ncbi:transketolase-like TK C-terminal-containing protein [Halomonas sp. BC04]|uniref:transketolase-like TK C-terminal-containing protein n=1 Tax=Halomonas sp. BC04 TaxID=1403540 RepID=UPI003FA60202
MIKGLYRLPSHAPSAPKIRLLGSGAILNEVIRAADRLAEDWQVQAEVWSATSFSELARDAREVERRQRFHPLDTPRRSHLANCLEGDIPIVAASDYVRAYPQLIAGYVRPRFLTLGTDGFGRSDTRTAMRDFFEVDATHVVLAALQVLVEEGDLPAKRLADALAHYGIEPPEAAPWQH